MRREDEKGDDSEGFDWSNFDRPVPSSPPPSEAAELIAPDDAGSLNQAVERLTSQDVAEPVDPALVSEQPATAPELSDGVTGDIEAENGSLSNVYQVRCHVCQLPREVQLRVREMRFRRGLSNEKIALELVPMLKGMGIEIEVGPRNLSNHFSHHGLSEERTLYRLRARESGGRSLTLGRSAEEVAATLRDLDVKSLRDSSQYVADSLLGLFEKQAVGLESLNLTVGSEFRDRAYATQVKLGKAALAAIESVHRLGDPQEIMIAAVSLVHEAFIDGTNHGVAAFVRDLVVLLDQTVGSAASAQLRPGLDRLLGDLAATLASLKGRARGQLEGALDVK